MKRLLFTALTVSSIFLKAQLAGAAEVNIVHGIDGRDLSLARSLPVDIAVNGVCSLKGVHFTQSAKVDLPPATYTVTVHLTDGGCSQTPVITKVITIPDDGSRSFSAVASLSSAGVPQLAVFNNSKEFVFPPAIAVRHLANARPVFVKFSSRELLRPNVRRIMNGESTSLQVFTRKFAYAANIQSSARGGVFTRRSGVTGGRYSILNIVGSRANGFTIIAESLKP